MVTKNGLRVVGGCRRSTDSRKRSDAPQSSQPAGRPTAVEVQGSRCPRQIVATLVRRGSLALAGHEPSDGAPTDRSVYGSRSSPSRKVHVGCQRQSGVETSLGSAMASRPAAERHPLTHLVTAPRWTTPFPLSASLLGAYSLHVRAAPRRDLPATHQMPAGARSDRFAVIYPAWCGSPLAAALAAPPAWLGQYRLVRTAASASRTSSALVSVAARPRRHQCGGCIERRVR